MCLNPIQIYNKSTYLNSANAPIRISVPCGKCAECLKAKQNEYTLRSYYEHKDSCYTYFDTLTYDDSNLPHYKDIPCFNRKDVKDFLKRLRTDLDRKGFGTNCFKYFLCSEYGGKRHRPHYHILFFVKNPKLDVLNLKHSINKSWWYGITDSILTTKKRVVNNMAAINYVAKYVTKDQEYQSTIDKKLNYLMNTFKNQELDNLKEHLKDMRPFHLQSQSYGLSMLYDQRLLRLAEQECSAELPIDGRLPKKLFLPMYFQRKLFYDLVKDGDKRRWVLNDLGYTFKMGQIEKSTRLLKDRYTTIYNNLDQYTDNPLYFKWRIDKCLDGRSIEDFTKYVLFYRGHLNLKRLDDDIAIFNDTLVPIDEYLNLKLQLTNDLINPLHHEDYDIRKEWREKLESFMITQDTFEEFRFFDNLYVIFLTLSNSMNKGIIAYDKEVTELKARLALLKH